MVEERRQATLISSEVIAFIPSLIQKKGISTMKTLGFLALIFFTILIGCESSTDHGTNE